MTQKGVLWRNEKYGCLLPFPKMVGEVHQKGIAVDTALCSHWMGFLDTVEEKPCWESYCPLKVHPGEEEVLVVYD